MVTELVLIYSPLSGNRLWTPTAPVSHRFSLAFQRKSVTISVRTARRGITLFLVEIRSELVKHLNNLCPSSLLYVVNIFDRLNSLTFQGWATSVKYLADTVDTFLKLHLWQDHTFVVHYEMSPNLVDVTADVSRTDFSSLLLSTSLKEQIPVQGRLSNWPLSKQNIAVALRLRMTLRLFVQNWAENLTGLQN